MLSFDRKKNASSSGSEPTLWKGTNEDLETLSPLFRYSEFFGLHLDLAGRLSSAQPCLRSDRGIQGKFLKEPGERVFVSPRLRVA